MTLGHVARFVPPGSAAAGLDYFAHVAFVRPDGGVVVVLNATEADVDWSLVMGGDAWTLTTPAHALQARWLAVPCGGELELSSFSVGIWGS